MTEFTLMDQAGSDLTNLSEKTAKKVEAMFYQINTLLGGTTLPIHLGDDDFNAALKTALDTYRNGSGRSYFSTYGTLVLKPNTQKYRLNDKIDTVVRIYRSQGISFGSTAMGFDSFGQAAFNSLMLNNFGSGAGGIGFDMIGYESIMQFSKLLDKMFAREIQFRYRPDTRELIIFQNPNREETVILLVSVLKTVDQLMDDHYSYNWIRKYTEAVCRQILGEKYTFTNSIPGAQGGTVLKGERLITQAEKQITELEADLYAYVDSGDIPTPVKG